MAAARVLAEYAPHLRDPIVLGLVVWLFNCSKSDERAGAKTAAGAAASPTAKLEPACDQVIEGVDEHSFSNAALSIIQITSGPKSVNGGRGVINSAAKF